MSRNASKKFKCGQLNFLSPGEDTWTGGDSRFTGNITLFKLDTCYDEFKLIARRSLMAAINYNDDVVNGILKTVRGNKEEAYRMILHSNYAEDGHHLLPFSKVNKDIIDQYGSGELKSALNI